MGLPYGVQFVEEVMWWVSSIWHADDVVLLASESYGLLSWLHTRVHSVATTITTCTVAASTGSAAAPG